MEVDLQKEIQDFYVRLKMLLHDKNDYKQIELTLEENGKAYVTNIKDSKLINIFPEWLSGYLFEGKEFATLDELCSYYGITKDGLKVLIDNNNDLKNIGEIINVIEYAKVDVSKALNYMIENPSIPYVYAITDLNPNCYVNILGELINPVSN